MAVLLLVLPVLVLLAGAGTVPPLAPELALPLVRGVPLAVLVGGVAGGKEGRPGLRPAVGAVLTWEAFLGRGCGRLEGRMMVQATGGKVIDGRALSVSYCLLLWSGGLVPCCC